MFGRHPINRCRMQPMTSRERAIRGDKGNPEPEPFPLPGLKLELAGKSAEGPALGWRRMLSCHSTPTGSSCYHTRIIHAYTFVSIHTDIHSPLD